MASAAKKLRYSNTGMVYGDLAYDLDRELRERQFRHAGEAPRQRQAAKELPQVRRATRVQTRYVPCKHVLCSCLGRSDGIECVF